MRHYAISLMLASATLLAGHPAAAQDAGAPKTAQEKAPDIGELLKMLDGLPTLNDLPQSKSLRNQEPGFDTSKPVLGLGMQIVDGEVVVARVMEGSAAEAAGLKVGMVIKKINGVNLTGFSLEEIAKMIGAIDHKIVFSFQWLADIYLLKARILQEDAGTTPDPLDWAYWSFINARECLLLDDSEEEYPSFEELSRSDRILADAGAAGLGPALLDAAARHQDTMAVPYYVCEFQMRGGGTSVDQLEEANDRLERAVRAARSRD